jgi:histidinol phosphatase-like PHP family hydrolase
MKKATISRREFLGRAAALSLVSAASGPLAAQEKEPDWLPTTGEGIPLVDYHVHVDKPATLEQVLAISRQRGVKFGIVEHAGTKANKYPRILSSDEELKGYLAELEGKPVFKGVQAEWIDWMTCFSKETIAKLDYVLTDAMTLRGKDGKPVRMWDPGFKVDGVQDFMDRYVDFHVELMSLEPIDILANPTYLPGSIAKDYDALWTPTRVQKIIDAAVKYGIAIEINAGYRIPRLALLKQAKAAGAKFSFGTNIRGPNVGKLDYCLEMVKALGLTRADIFTPAPAGKKAVQRR